MTSFSKVIQTETKSAKFTAALFHLIRLFQLIML